MKERLKSLFEYGSITKDGIYNAVNKGWITAAEANEIINGTEGGVKNFLKFCAQLN